MEGILVIDKKEGITSRDVVNIVSKKFNIKKVGHTGTLDPLATGALVVAIGKATKIIELLTSDDKEYFVEVKMGIKTDTLDITGNILEEQEIKEENLEKIKEILESFVGTYLQEVPVYSAVRVKGKRLYEYARNHEEVNLPKRNVTIKNITLHSIKKDEFSFSCHVSKGTYIRSLVRDIGEKLGIVCTMKTLRRTKQGIFSLDQACTIEDLENDKYNLISLLDALKNYPQVIIDKALEKKIRNGVAIKRCFDGNLGVLYNEEKELLAIYQKDERDEELIKPWKVFS